MVAHGLESSRGRASFLLAGALPTPKAGLFLSFIGLEHGCDRIIEPSIAISRVRDRHVE